MPRPKSLTPEERQAMADQTASEERERRVKEGTYVSPTRAGAVEPPLMNEDPAQTEDLEAIAAQAPDDLDEDFDQILELIKVQGEIQSKRGLHAKIAEVILEIEYIQKTGTAPAAMGGYSFVEAGQIAAKLRKALASRGVTMLPERIEQVDIRPSIKGTMTIQTIKTTWRLTDSETGEFAFIESMGSGGDSGDKFSPKAQTNAMKYALQVGFLLETGDDPEKFDLTEEPPQGAPVITGSSIQGVQQGGRQTKATSAQLDVIRRAAREADLTPEAFSVLIGSALGGKLPDLDGKDSENDQRKAILDFLGELSFDEAASVVQAVTTV